MSWCRGKYYYRNVRVGKRIVSQYIGAGLVAQFAADLDQVDRQRRAEARAARRQVAELGATPVALITYLGQVRTVMERVLLAAGYHQHKRVWRKRRMASKVPELTDQAYEQWVTTTIGAMHDRDAPAVVRRDYRELLRLEPRLARENGDLARIALREMRRRFEQVPAASVAIEHQAAALRRELAGPNPSPIELLLVDAVLLRWHDHYSFAIVYAQRAVEGLSLDTIEQYERILASKQQCYERAILTLARVRRLLRLPALQVNIAAAGGQQVNVQG